MKKRAKKTEQPYTEQCEICSRWFERVFSVIENFTLPPRMQWLQALCYGNVDREHRGDSGPSKRATFAHWAKNLLKENGLLPIEGER